MLMLYVAYVLSRLSNVFRSIPVSYLLQFPMELGRSEGIHLGEISPQQEHQAAIVHIQRVVMAVHLCWRERRKKV